MNRSRRTQDFLPSTPFARNTPVAIAVFPNTCTDIDSGATCCSWEPAFVPDGCTLARNSALVCTEPSSFTSSILLSRSASSAFASPDLYAGFHAHSRAGIFDLVVESDASCLGANKAVAHNKPVKRLADFILPFLQKSSFIACSESKPNMQPPEAALTMLSPPTSAVRRPSATPAAIDRGTPLPKIYKTRSPSHSSPALPIALRNNFPVPLCARPRQTTPFQSRDRETAPAQTSLPETIPSLSRSSSSQKTGRILRAVSPIRL